MDERERFRHAQEVFLRACGLEGDERERFLREACADEAIRREVEGLLEEDGAPLIGESAGVGLAEELLSAAGAADGSAPEVDGFEIVRPIGEGGMGVVYEAEQLRPRRRVALKLLRSGMGSGARLRRFQLESEFLGRLRHPCVAQVFGVGAARDGRPYFAMELVEGRSITEHAHAAGLGVAARVRLFLSVCEGVTHAHQRGVIHRDLKPGNILVDHAGAVKVLDFGIARATESDAASTLQTIEGQLVGTLAYMSPEQAAGDPGAIDTRTDVYSLGVVLYELLCGRGPHEGLGEMTLDEALRAIRTGEPTRPGAIDRRLRGDLETIALKALEKDRDRRYQGVAELGEDLRRFLRDEPVLARPPSTMYQLRKFTARHRPLVVGAGAVAGAVLLGLVGTLIALQRAIDAERLAEARLADATAALERADQQAEIAEAAKAFLTEDLLAAANPDAMGGDAPVREVLRAASERIGERTDLDPLFKSEILLSMGKTLSVAGEFELARGHLEEALAIREELYGDDHLLTVDALKELGSAYVIASQVEPSRVERSKRVLDVRMRDLGPEHNQTLVAMNDYALALDDLNRDDEAIPVYEEAIEMARATLGPDSEREATLLHNFAAVMEQRDAARSEEMYREALRIRAKVLGPEHSRTLLAANSLASFYWSADRLDEAEPIYVETLAARIELLGETHPHTLNSMDNLGTLYLKRGDWDRAMAHTGRALEIIRAEFGPRSFRAARTMNNVAAIHRGMGDYAEAERIFGEAYDILRSQDGRELYAGWIRRNQGHMLWELERYDEAESAMVEAVAVLSEVSGDGDFRTRSALTLLGDFYEDRGRTDEAAATRARLGD